MIEKLKSTPGRIARLLGLDFRAQAEREVEASERAAFPPPILTRADLNRQLAAAGIPPRESAS